MPQANTVTVTQSPPVQVRTGSRVAGIDVARALAIVGMMFAHIGISEDSFTGNAAHILATGLPSALFAVLTGVSLGFMGQSGAIAGGECLASSRSKLYVRGMLVVVIGLALTYMQSRIAVVLMAIGIEIILLTPAVRWRTRTLLIWWAVLFLLGAAVTTLLRLSDFYPMLITLGYPLPAWLLYGITGILLHRHLIYSGPRAWTVAATIGAVVAGLGIWWWRLDVLDIGHDSPFFDFHDPDLTVARDLFLSAAPHSGGLGDVLVSVGAAVTTVGLCLLACHVRWAEVLLYPLRATGSMALTVYVAHVLTATMLTGFSLMTLIGHGYSSSDRPEHDAGWTLDASLDDGDPSSSSAVEFPNEPAWEEYQRTVGESTGWEDFRSREEHLWEDFLSEQERLFDEYIREKENQGDAGAPLPAQQNGLDVDGFGVTALGALLISSLWRWRFRRGPLEGLLRWIIGKATRSDLPPRATPASP
ncbi:heparan-alpha-glucosaminide N-acetyltransferase domain-containing protein [Corynebacterium sp. CCM 9203]|uniref:heparan-alpha-glucosaminide N-acetyltransferase domain-containing protein n=1 Tax=Corynebacterium sp. CCM 9203 TaxID=3057615 RepID=UPI0035258BBE